MNRFHHLAGLFVAFGLCAQAPPVLAQDALSVSKDAISPGGVWRLWTVAGADDVTIKDVVVNRGRCKPWLLSDAAGGFPIGLKSAEKRLLGQYLCNPIEIEVATDQGRMAFELDDELARGPLSVSKSDSIEPGHIWELRFTMRAEDGTIESVVANQGDCKPHAPPALPRSLTFGETVGDFVYFCEPTEVTVTTNQGVSIFSWNKSVGDKSHERAAAR